MDIKDVFGTGEVVTEIVKQTGEMAKEPIANIVNPTSKTTGVRLADIIDLVFTPIEIAKIYKDHKVELFKSKLSEKIGAIPTEKRVAPPINIVFPAVEAAKYYIDDEKLRDMFAELIANSMNADTSNLTHPSYVEIIKQLSPMDATNIAAFKKAPFQTIVDYILKSNVDFPIVTNVVLNLSSNRDIYAISNSITNLLRLGLLERDFSIHADTDDKYMDEDLIQQVQSSVSESGDELRKMINVKHGFIRTTTYGRLFIATCIG